MRKIKKGLFLSIELMVILIVIIAIIAITAFGILRLIEDGEVTKIAKEYREYSEAAIKFKAMYEYWPGDLPAERIIKEMPDNTLRQMLISDITTIESLQNPASLVKDADATIYPNNTVVGSGNVSNAKSDLVFRQLQAFGLIYGKVDLSNPIYPLTTAQFTANGNMWPRAYEIVMRGHLPKAGFNNSLAWQFLFTISNKITDTGGVMSRSIYSSPTTGINRKVNWSMIPKLTLFSYGSLPNAKLFASGKTGSCAGPQANQGSLTANPSTAGACLNTSGNFYAAYAKSVGGYDHPFYTPVAALSASSAYKLDKKIDDGLPNGPTSVVFGSDIVPFNSSPTYAGGTEVAAEVFGCTTYGAHLAAADVGYVSWGLMGNAGNTQANRDIWNANGYAKSDNDSPYKGCVMSFAVIG